MTVVLGVAASVVDVVHVVAMRNRDVATSFAMSVVVIVVGGMPCGFALVVMSVVHLVQMSIVDVIDVVAMRDRNVAASLAVFMVMRRMF
jgi:hypothetical protein